MRKINVVTIHGIGVTGPEYAKALIKGVKEEFNRALQKNLATTSDFANGITFKEIVWDDILAENQEKLKEIFRKALSRKKINIIKGILSLLSTLAAILLFYFFRKWWAICLLVCPVFCCLTILVYRLRTGFAAEFVNDIIGYQGIKAKQRINERIIEEVNTLREEAQTNITFISHSLGTVISSNFIYDQQKYSQGDFSQGFYLSNFFTMGSPLPLFSLQYGPEMFQNPIQLEDVLGRWLNIFDKDDPIAYPLKPLNEAYEKVVYKDKEVNTGIFGISHLNYWKNRNVHRIIGRKLAIDWLRLNNKLTERELNNLYEDYDRNLGL